MSPRVSIEHAPLRLDGFAPRQMSAILFAGRPVIPAGCGDTRLGELIYAIGRRDFLHNESIEADLAMQPGAREVPVAGGGPHGDAEHLSGFVKRKPGEIAQLHKVRLAWIACGQPIQCIVHGEQLVVVAKRCRNFDVLDVAMLRTGAAFRVR
ncbi:MAG: hypothetical protein QOE70_5779 [Chthoniobacter sp.]|nr:hypothetical protein [Chthoniobacter sp.]